MLMRKLQEACATMAVASRLRDDKAAVEKLNLDLKHLKTAADQLQVLAEIIQTMETCGIAPAVLTREQRDTLNQCISTCGEKTDNSTLSESDVSALKSAASTCRREVEQVWKTSESKRVADGVYNSLYSLKGLLPDQTGTEKLLKRLAENKDALPKSGKGIVYFVNDVNRSQDLLNSLNLDPQIENFLVKARMHQATLSDLNDHILEWIKKNHLTSKLKIQF